MLIDLDRAWPPMTRTTEVCVIGGGPAGITAARHLLAQGHEVFLLEAGCGGQRPRSQPCHRQSPHRFGGCTSASAGPCVELATHLAPHSAHEGWPIAAADLEHAYEQARRSLNFPVWRPHPDDLETRGVSYPAFDKAAIEIGVARVDRTKERFAFHRCDDLIAHARCTVIVHAVALEIGTDQTGHTAEHVLVISPGGTRLRVEAKAIVVAAGVMETPRLLLASRGSHAEGLGNHHGNVGRYLSLGAPTFAGTIESDRAWSLLRVFGRRHVFEGEEMIVQLRPSAELRKRENIGSASISISSGPVSPQTAANVFGAQRPRGALRDWIRYQLGRSTLALRLDDEQMGDPDARVQLICERDDFDRPKIEVRGSQGENARRAASTMVRTLRREFRRLGLGAVKPAAGLDDPALPQRWTEAEVAATQITVYGSGTTRMANRPSHGVVDEYGAVFDIAGLWIVGPSVLPSGGGANALLTILALSHRIAARVSRHLRAPCPELSARPNCLVEGG